MTAEFTAEESMALESIDKAAVAALLLDLIAVPSVTGSAAESELQHRLARRLDGLGLDVDLWSMDLPALRRHPGFPGTEAPRRGMGSGGDRRRRGDGPAMILQGHVDVVPPGDLARWGGDPFVPRVTGGVVHGRGACDMKAGLVANLAALAAIRSAGIALRGRVAAHFVAGEEDGGLGAFGTLQRGHTGDACIITEPTSGTLVTANAGALTFRLEVPGKATHASTRDAGVSAIDAYLPIREALIRFEAHRNADPDPLLAEYAIPYPSPSASSRRRLGQQRPRPARRRGQTGRPPRRGPRPPPARPSRAAWPGCLRVGPLAQRPPGLGDLAGRRVRERPPAGR